MGARYAGAVRRSRQDGEERRDDAGRVEYGLPSRPHAKTHKCAAIAKYQLATGSIGICCAKLSEAEAMVANGVDKILMTTSNPSKNKIKRAMALKGASELHSGRRRGAERARSVGGRQGG